MSEERALLEVVCLHVRDVAAATVGGADRLLLLTDPVTGGLSPTLAEVSVACRETDLPVRVMLRANAGYATDGDELARFVELATGAASLGAAGFTLGFLDADLDVDVATTRLLLSSLPGLPWTFHRGFDSALRTDHAWHAVGELPRIDAVASGGSPQGLAVGGDDLVARATADAGVARLVLASGGLEPAIVPWLVRAGVRQFGVDTAARAGDSWTRGHVDADRVRSWRLLLDDAVDRARGVPVD